MKSLHEMRGRDERFRKFSRDRESLSYPLQRQKPTEVEDRQEGRRREEELKPQRFCEGVGERSGADIDQDDCQSTRIAQRSSVRN